MPDSNQYELIVKNILQSKQEGAISTDDLEIQHNAHFTGKSGHNHQIDIAAEMRVAGLRILTLIECKKYSHKVGVDEIMEFATRIEDIGLTKAYW